MFDILKQFCKSFVKKYSLEVPNSRQSVTGAHIYEVKKPVFEAQKSKSNQK